MRYLGVIVTVTAIQKQHPPASRTDGGMRSLLGRRLFLVRYETLIVRCCYAAKIVRGDVARASEKLVTVARSAPTNAAG